MTREQARDLLTSTDSGADVMAALADFFALTDDDLTDDAQPLDAPGVLWAGDGTQVQRVDCPDDGRAPLFPGDMEAAVFLAGTTAARWLAYFPQHDDNPWEVRAFVSRDDAGEAVMDAYDVGAFAWDGRAGLPPEQPGYAPHPDAYAVMTAELAAERDDPELYEEEATQTPWWTVFGVYEDDGQPFAHYVRATVPEDAKAKGVKVAEDGDEGFVVVGVQVVAGRVRVVA
jgi:hypothetical protein